MRSPYPLQWPEGVKRALGRAASPFKVDLDQARRELYDDLARMNGSDIVLTSDRDGGDKGVAAYYWRNNKEHCIACDLYSTKAANVRAIGHVVAALRTIERHGGKYLLDQASQAFELPQLPARRRAWHVVLGVTEEAPDEVVRAAYRAMAAKYHPDQPTGDRALYDEVQDAMDTYKQERGL